MKEHPYLPIKRLEEWLAYEAKCSASLEWIKSPAGKHHTKIVRAIRRVCKLAKEHP